MHLLVGLYCMANGQTQQAVQHFEKCEKCPLATSSSAFLRNTVSTTSSQNLIDQAVSNIANGLRALRERKFDVAT